MMTIRVNKWKDICNVMLSVIQTFALCWWGWIFSAISLIPTLCNASRLGELESYPGDNLLLLKFIHLSYIFIFACFIKLWNGTMIHLSFTSWINRQHQHKKADFHHELNIKIRGHVFMRGWFRCLLNAEDNRLICVQVKASYVYSWALEGTLENSACIIIYCDWHMIWADICICLKETTRE